MFSFGTDNKQKSSMGRGAQVENQQEFQDSVVI